VSFVAAMLSAYAQESRSEKVMIAAVSRDDSILTPGISTGKKSPKGEIHLEILAYLSPGGGWSNHPCAQDYSGRCDRFAKEYLAKPHDFKVVSTDGRGAKVQAKPVTLSECDDYETTATYDGAEILGTALAASSVEWFSSGSSARPLGTEAAKAMMQSLSSLVPVRLDSLAALRFYSVVLEGQPFVVIQRAFQDYGSDRNYDTGMDKLKYIFAIGKNQGDRFELLHWKENVEDDNEQVLGTVHLKSGRDFLVTTTSDPEGQHFRVYGIKEGKLAIVFEGGGSSC
jgi:hypothetical protein